MSGLPGMLPRRRRGFEYDSPLEETVSSEPVSGAQFPVTRVNTGNFVKFEAPQPIKWSKLAVKPEAYRGVPVSFNREFFAA